MLDNPLVEALEAGREQGHVLELGELFDHLLGQLPPLRAERNHRMRGALAVHRVERRGDDVDPQDHPRPTPVRLVVDLAVLQPRQVAGGEEPQVELVPEHRRDRPLLGQPRERVRDEREDVELHQSSTVNPSATTMRPPVRSTSRTQSSIIGSRTPVSSSSTSLATPVVTALTLPSSRPFSSTTGSPTISKA